MWFSIREGSANGQRVAVTRHSMPEAAHRPVVAVMLVTVALLALSAAVTSLPSRAATVPSARHATTVPAVSPVTVTVPKAKTPQPAATVPAAAPPTATAPPATATPAPAPPTPGPTGTAPPVTPAPARTTPVTPSAPTPPVSAPAIAIASRSGFGSSPPRSPRARRVAAVPQQQLRSLVIRLSSCLSRLRSGSERMLLRRAGIGVARPSSRRAVARSLHMSVSREVRRERAALRTLQTAARHQRCGSTPAWVHVPVGDRLVLVDPILTTVATSSTKVSFTPSATLAGAPLMPGLVYAWWKLAWTAARQS